MRLDPIAMISLMLAALLAGVVGAFFLYVSPLTIFYVGTIVTAMMGVFGLGLLAGAGLPIRPRGGKRYSLPVSH